jgi:phosphatidylglycerophosphatase A
LNNAVSRADRDIHFESISVDIAALSITQQSLIIRDNSIIDQLYIADCLKDFLISHGFTLELLQSMSAHNLAKNLGIDEYVARMIAQAAVNYDIKRNKNTPMLSTTKLFRNDNFATSFINGV